MIRVQIDTDAPYEALVGKGLLAELGALIARVHAPCRSAVIADDTVAALYGEKATGALKKAGFSPALFAFPAGEEHKTLATFAQAQAFLIDMGLTRADIVVTLGGGVAGDLGGFAAATYQRGVPFVQAPTTLLCAVDASVGGKTAVDMPGGKNMVGAFHQPLLVACDTDTFRTLPESRVADGAAEALKHGLIADGALFDRMKTGDWRKDTEHRNQARFRRWGRKGQGRSADAQFRPYARPRGRDAERLCPFARAGRGAGHGDGDARGEQDGIGARGRGRNRARAQRERPARPARLFVGGCAGKRPAR